MEFGAKNVEQIHLFFRNENVKVNLGGKLLFVFAGVLFGSSKLYETQLSKRKQRRCHSGYLSVMRERSSIKP